MDNHQNVGLKQVGLRQGSMDRHLDYIYNQNQEGQSSISPRFDAAKDEFKRRCEDNKLYTRDPASHGIRLMPFRSRSTPATGDRYAMSASAGPD